MTSKNEEIANRDYESKCQRIGDPKQVAFDKARQ